MKRCPGCDGELERVEPGIYTCKDCSADYEAKRSELVRFSDGVMPTTHPSDEDLIDAYEGTFSSQGHLPDNDYV